MLKPRVISIPNALMYLWFLFILKYYVFYKKKFMCYNIFLFLPLKVVTSCDWLHQSHLGAY